MRTRRVTAVGLLATLALIAGPSAAEAVNVKPGIEVAPGVYLASASELGAARGDDSPARAHRKTQTPTPRIVGGRPATISRWPWQISLSNLTLGRGNEWKNHDCGGSLVAPTIVVTAAHCVTGGLNTDFKPASNFQVVSGRTRLSSGAGQVIDLADYYWFVDQNGTPLFNPSTAEWDVVFLRLASSSTEQPIKIAGPDESAVWTPGRRAFVTGWGQLDEHPRRGPDVLRQARIRMISDSKCESVYGPILFPTMVCAGHLAGGVDACGGDSGGPLVVPVSGRRYRLVGDVSFAAGCGDPGVPGVYGRLAGDPIRTALKNGIKAVAGVNVIGSGGQPSNDFRIGSLRRDKRRGTATLAVRVPGRGKLRMRRTADVRPDAVFPTADSTAHLKVRPQGEAKAHLDRHQSVTVRIRVTYRPFMGEKHIKSLKVRLVKRR